MPFLSRVFFIASGQAILEQTCYPLTTTGNSALMTGRHLKLCGTDCRQSDSQSPCGKDLIVIHCHVDGFEVLVLWSIDWRGLVRKQLPQLVIVGEVPDRQSYGEKHRGFGSSPAVHFDDPP